MIRAMFGRAERETGNKHPGLNDMGKWTCWALTFTVVVVSWLTFKEFEPQILPVIEDFEVTRAIEQPDGTVHIYGSFRKIRQCQYEGIVAYSGPTFVRVRFMDNAGRYYPNVTRLPRSQNFGPWKLEPKTAQLELYITHQCVTGTVTTELFKGALVL